MTKRRKIYEDKRIDRRNRRAKAINAVINGMSPDTVRKRYGLYDAMIDDDELRARYIPRKTSLFMVWITGLKLFIKEIFRIK